jgi:hypothetical protein
MPTTPVSAVWLNNQVSHITSKIVKHTLQDAVVVMGETNLASKNMRLEHTPYNQGQQWQYTWGGVPVFAIMMIGQWGSNAFMKYIQKQIEEFTFPCVIKNADDATLLPCSKRSKQSE